MGRKNKMISVTLTIFLIDCKWLNHTSYNHLVLMSCTALKKMHFMQISISKMKGIGNRYQKWSFLVCSVAIQTVNVWLRSTF